MYAPTKAWRRWHRKINIGTKRYAVCSALAASAIPALVMARGHRIGQINEVPLVVSAETLANVDKTKKAVAVLKKLNLYEDVEKVIKSRGIRAGQGKARNRRYVQRLGPLIIYKEKSNMIRAFRNIPGIDFVNVEHLNLLKLAPGGHLGRLIMWTSDAFAELDQIFGTYKAKSQKTGFSLPRPAMQNTDLLRLLRSPELAKYLRPKKTNVKVPMKRNPLKNAVAMARLNPYAIIERRKTILAQVRKQHPSKFPAKKTTEKTAAERKVAKKAINKKFKVQRKNFRKFLFSDE
jgi:large subunit ribosomal protein L4e